MKLNIQKALPEHYFEKDGKILGYYKNISKHYGEKGNDIWWSISIWGLPNKCTSTSIEPFATEELAKEWFNKNIEMVQKI